jgi:hypothetical protein
LEPTAMMEIMPLEPDGLDSGFEPQGDGGLRAASPVYNDLVNQATMEFLDQFAEIHGPRLMNLTRLWNVAGSPEGKSPAEWLQSHPAALPGEEVADHGAGGMGTSWDLAVHYASTLDDRIVPRLILTNQYGPTPQN